jgi:hypothetical protein
MSDVVPAFVYRVVGEDSSEAVRTVMGETQGISLAFVIAVLWRGASFHFWTAEVENTWQGGSRQDSDRVGQRFRWP